MLALEKNPPIRPPGSLPIDQTPDDWLAVHVRPRTEKRIAAELLNVGIDYFLPVRERRFVSGGRKRVSLLPLFPSYVFARVDDVQLPLLYACPAFVRVIRDPDMQRLHRQLASLERLLQLDRGCELHPALAVGTPVRVVRGPLAGVEGVIVRWESGYQLRVGISLLSQSAAVPVDVADVRKLNA
jgi:transcription antitermination factor NusG